MEATTTAWGVIGGRTVERTTLKNANGMSLCLTPYGATILSIKVPSRGGGPAGEVTLCHSNLDDLRAHSPYYGCTVGRVANRIAQGKYKVRREAAAQGCRNSAAANPQSPPAALPRADRRRRLFRRRQQRPQFPARRHGGL